MPGAYEQCGGMYYKGSTTCASGLTCRKQDQYYSQCVPATSGQANSSSQSQNFQSLAKASTSNNPLSAYSQCGGMYYKGSTTCASGLICRKQDQYYSQCVPAISGQTKQPNQNQNSQSIQKPQSSLATSTSLLPAYSQCGGKFYKGSTSCASGLVCQKQNDYYSQCIPGTTNQPQSSGPGSNQQQSAEQDSSVSKPNYKPKPQSNSNSSPPSTSGKTTFKAQLTTRDDECIKDNSKCSSTQGGSTDPGALGKTSAFPYGQTQCGTDPLAKNIIGLDSVHFGTDSDGVKTAMCGKTVTITNPKNGKTVQAVVTDRIPRHYGGGVSQVDASIGLTMALGPDQPGGLNIAEVVVSY